MIYVVIQFSCIIYLILNARYEHLDFTALILLLVALIIGLTAVVNMKVSNLNIMPTLKKSHQLRTNGIYQFIRHPMYTSVLLLCLALMLSNVHYISQTVMLILFVDLILKSRFEEKLLTKRFDNYQAYKEKTGRFIPFL
ncbi:methyltransferase family protein [Candidatus Thioglobus autotrophicus]|uniref:methyltransferase family protein n=1 Tax=Candidatus Thioglobus autotrophicus TaxID=1705394 RepID=UPI00299D01C9|nr:NnrU family protein [Candidatus Thioglobus autotrophicus]WPE17417.1 NnrU family protein [Candidatus Thioglobus autotrophicus]